MSRDTKRLNLIKEKLDRVSPTYCPVRWKHSSINIGLGAAKSCCHFGYQPIDTERFVNGEHPHDTLRDQAERREMLRGERTRSCSGCHWQEDRGQFSDRVFWSDCGFIKPFISEMVDRPQEGLESPSWVEISFSNVCNLKCSYCTPLFSSSWLKESKEFGPFPTSRPFNGLEQMRSEGHRLDFDSDSLKEPFRNWFRNVYQGIRLLKITGGEPLLNEQTYFTLEWLRQNPAPHLTLAINSNLSLPESTFKRFVAAVRPLIQERKIQSFYLHPSLDAVGIRGEYIRHGLKFDVFKRNLDLYLNQTKGNLSFICTVNNLSLLSLESYWDFAIELKRAYLEPGRLIQVSTEVLENPPWQSISILPQSYTVVVQTSIARILQRLQGYMVGDHEISRLKRLPELLDCYRGDVETARADFYRFFMEHDRRRKTDFKATFPELLRFWRLCEKSVRPPLWRRLTGFKHGSP